MALQSSFCLIIASDFTLSYSKLLMMYVVLDEHLNFTKYCKLTY